MQTRKIQKPGRGAAPFGAPPPSILPAQFPFLSPFPNPSQQAALLYMYTHNPTPQNKSKSLHPRVGPSPPAVPISIHPHSRRLRPLHHALDEVRHGRVEEGWVDPRGVRGVACLPMLVILRRGARGADLMFLLVCVLGGWGFE